MSGRFARSEGLALDQPRNNFNLSSVRMTPNSGRLFGDRMRPRSIGLLFNNAPQLTAKMGNAILRRFVAACETPYDALQMSECDMNVSAPVPCSKKV